MVTYDKNEKDLVIPSALGLAGMQDSVCGVTEQEVIEIVESAITDYDTEIQVDLEDIRENVSGNTDDIAALSAATEALEQRVDDISTSALTEQIEALSGSVGDIRSDVETLSGDTDSIRTDVAALSAAVSGVTGDVDTLSAATSGVASDLVALSAATSGIAIDVETAFKSETILRSDLTSLSGRTSAITEQITELSGVTSGIAIDVVTLSGATVAVEQAVAGKQDALTAGNGIDISGATISVKAGEGLGFSGDTLVVSGISGLEDIPHYVYLSTGSGRTDLYDDLVEAYDAGKKVIMEAIDAENRSSNGKVYLDLTKVLTATTTAGTVVYASFIFSGEGLPNTGNGLRIFKVTVNRIGYGGVSGTQTINNIYYASKNEIISNYTLPTAAANTKGGIKTGSGVTMSGDFLSVKYGDGLGMSGDTLVVSGGTGGGDYLIVDALSAVTSPEDGQMAQVRTQVNEIEYVRFYVTDGGTYPQEGYWGAIKYGGETRAIYSSSSDFYWDYGDGNANSGWFAGELFGYTYEYRCMKPDRDGVEYPEFHIALPENSPLTVSIWDEGGGEQPQGIATAVTAETVYDYSVPAVYTNEVWTPLSKVFTKNDFPNSASTAQVIQEVRDMVARGVYPEVHWNSKMLFYESDAGIWITFKSMYENISYRVYISDTVFDDNGFDSRGIRVDENGISFPEENLFARVDSAGTLTGDLSYAAYDDYQWRNYIYYQPDGEDYKLGVAPLKWRYNYRTLWTNPDTQEQEEKFYYVFSADIPINNTIYTGVWGVLQDNWYDDSPVPHELLSWTSGATYTSQNFPPYVPQE